MRRSIGIELTQEEYRVVLDYLKRKRDNLDAIIDHGGASEEQVDRFNILCDVIERLEKAR